MEPSTGSENSLPNCLALTFRGVSTLSRWFEPVRELSYWEVSTCACACRGSSPTEISRKHASTSHRIHPPRWAEAAVSGGILHLPPCPTKRLSQEVLRGFIISFLSDLITGLCLEDSVVFA